MDDLRPDIPLATVPDELIVDLREIDLVEAALTALHLDSLRVAELAVFDLARLRLWHRSQQAGGEPVPVTDVDPLLAELRRLFAAECGGWNPVLGKNRFVSSQFGAYPQTQSMAGEFEPEPADRPDPVPEARPDGGAGVRVGVLDTRLYRHPDLAGHYETPDAGTGFDQHDADPIPWEDGHAAFVTGLIAAHAPKAEIVVRDVLDSDGRATAWDTVAAMARFRKDGIHILNLALGCRAHHGPPLVVQRAIERLTPDMLIVAAAGNHGQVDGLWHDITRRSATWPAALPGVVAVGGRTADDALAPYSPLLPWVTCTAPGNAVSTYLDGRVRRRHDLADFHGYASWKGTSIATSVVSGMVAARTRPGEVSAAQALAALLAEATVVRPAG
ncbi:S8/S53 family peptidase [Actinosynnema sp. NPDC047251]|uniref:Peptidase S8/S53 domain-containing protein n=1 Tax=Saccharothrix espanaensis (strain ATCC 51144 / DSM 44229 / JCM 9112 / NBRC 15066 / NRRL 15764) TaxID=1179773 RepID=K0JZ45_SACES|nr:S8/S53 family peptidase [Saccharothrix espanaensis]CCH31401.1 hypothetical protein BN6_41140 [Saccharothrix espanaensis DSM 44229]